ncbi:hypothetical protein FQN54_005321 [Arachnomyces sp. PD_36]|nr:hypothetical protein FQN54_005321 [Arachnomyces sp. PD_36]
MGLIKKAIKLTTVGGAATIGTFFFMTRNSSIISPLSPTDPLYKSAHYKKYNPLNNPTTNDICVRKVPLSEIDPSLLEKDGKLVEAFCAGVWGGLANASLFSTCYAFQRAYLERKYRGPLTSHQLWTKPELLSSNYPVGTQITDHFEVLEHTPNSIVVRCGDTPRTRDVRESEGLFEMSAVIKRDEGVAELGLKSIFYQGLGKSEGAMPPHITWLHQQYSKLWMESAVRNITR